MPQSEPKDKLLRVKNFWERLFPKRTRNKISVKITLQRKTYANKNILLTRTIQAAGKHAQHNSLIQYIFVESGNFLKTQFAIFRDKNIFQSSDAAEYLQINFCTTAKLNTYRELLPLLYARVALDIKSARELYLQTPNKNMEEFLIITPKLMHNFEFLRFLLAKGVFSEELPDGAKTKYIQDVDLPEFNIYDDDAEDDMNEG